MPHGLEYLSQVDEPPEDGRQRILRKTAKIWIEDFRVFAEGNGAGTVPGLTDEQHYLNSDSLFTAIQSFHYDALARECPASFY